MVLSGASAGCRGILKAVAIVLVAAGVGLCGVWTLGSPAVALAEPDYRSLRGGDRYETAVLVSQAGYSPGVGAVVLATGEDYPDALSAAPLAAAYGGPVLLTHSDSFDEVTQAEVARLQPGTIFIVGLAPEVIAQVKAAFPDLASAPEGIVALVGTDRYDTARLVAGEVLARLGSVGGVVLAPGDSYPDALSAAPLAAAKGWPILLTPAQGPLPEQTVQALQSLGTARALVVGTYVDPGLPGATVTRIAGRDRYDTSAMIAEAAVAEGASYGHVGITVGQNFPDALAAGPYLAQSDGIVLLTRADHVPEVTALTLLAQTETIASVDFIGVSPAVVSSVKMLLSAGDVPDGFMVSTLTMGSSGPEVVWLEQRLTELTYRPGPIDGVFDKRTYQAVLAFEKWEGLSRDGVVGPQVWARLLGASRPVAQRSGAGSWIEVDKGKQVLLYVEDGVVVRALPTATGSASVGIVTPTGTFTIYAKSPKWDGPRYKPLYLRGILAIHGYPSVPAWPASHGCVRLTTWDMDEFFPIIPVGTKVYIS